MKLRFRGNSLRLRVNRTEVLALASGAALSENVLFPNQARLTYVFDSHEQPTPQASFADGIIQVSAPLASLKEWARGESIGLYFDLATTDAPLRVSIEKDLECVDGPVEERDPDAFPRTPERHC